MTSDSVLQTYSYPRSCPKSELFTIQVKGCPVFVHATGVADFACFSFSGTVEIIISISVPVDAVTIRPLSRNIQAEIAGREIRFCLDHPTNLQIEINEYKPLHLYGNPLEQDVPSPDDPSVLYFKAGQTYEVGRLELKNDQTLYLEGGAILKGSLFATRAKNLRICGRGVLDGSYYRDEKPTRSVILDRCENVTLEDIIMIEPTHWMVVLGACRGVKVTNLKTIGQVMSSDGIDIVGCRDVTVAGCFLKNNDDCVVIKSCSTTEANGQKFDWIEDVDNIVVQDCVLMNDRCGNAMEIGHELRCSSVQNITFRNIDVLHVHGLGAVFSIHNSDHARVSHILWQDIRVEHCYDLFIDFRVFTSMWGKDNERGFIENVRLENIFWKRSIYNPGYTKSLMGGWNPTQPIRHVVIKNLHFDVKKITTQDELDLFTKSIENLSIL